MGGVSTVDHLMNKIDVTSGAGPAEKFTGSGDSFQKQSAAGKPLKEEAPLLSSLMPHEYLQHQPGHA